MTVRSLFLGAFVVTALLIFTGCQSAPKPEAKPDTAADMAALKALFSQFATAFNAGDAAAISATFSDDAILMPENEAAVEGRPAIQAFYEAKFKENALKIASEPPEIQVLGDWAYERGNGTVTFTPKTGKPMSESLKYLSIVKRQADSTWKYHRLITNNNNPPAAAAAKKK